MLVPRVCAPRVTRFSLGRYWSRDLCSKQAAERLAGWVYRLSSYLGQIGCQGDGVHRLSMTHSSGRQRNLMMQAQCPLPVYSSTGGSTSVVPVTSHRSVQKLDVWHRSNLRADSCLFTPPLTQAVKGHHAPDRFH